MPYPIERPWAAKRRELLRRSAGFALAGVAVAAQAQQVAGTSDGAQAGGSAPTAGSAAAGAAARSAPPPIGTRITLPPVRLVDGRELPASYWRDKVVVIVLWATWCPFCKRQNPHLDRLHRKHAGSGLEVLALSIDRSAEDAQRYLREHGLAFHAAMFDRRWQAAIGRPKGLPIVWVVGRDAQLKQVEIGEMFPEDIEELARWRTS
ncbi:MAG: TlpA family protein disulfide reductase [Burkholderiales bacterium]|nr:MAG: TlpA family protein disulfide reductase [Burkholderiales bacterium]